MTDLLPPDTRKRWLVTGAAGFIGSHLVQSLLKEGQDVIGLDNFVTGHRRNLDAAVAGANLGAEGRWAFVEADVRDLNACQRACEGVDVVLHQAALGSVPRSISDPAATHAHNATGSLNMLTAAKEAAVERFVFASSSSVYGDDEGLPKVEARVGRPLSPYAVSKKVTELYARTFFDHYDLPTVGLRYFNVFGPRQDPAGAYAAVIPRWVAALLRGETPLIYGDGQTSRDFCYVANVVQANLKAATAPASATGAVYNVAFGDTTTLNDLYGAIIAGLEAAGALGDAPQPDYAPFRPGDIRHSLADTALARSALGYAPTHSVRDGLDEALSWYIADATPALASG